MRRWLGVLMLLTATPVAAAQGDRGAEVAAALERDPVYVAPARADRLGIAEQGEVRLRIVRKDNGRIRIAVVPGSWAREAGGAKGLAEAIDAELTLRGALLVVSDREAHVITSHQHATAAATAVQRAFDHGGSLAEQLRRSVDGLAEVDPGPSSDPAPEAAVPDFDVALPDFRGITETVDTGIKATFFVVLGTVVAIFLLVAFLMLRGLRRSRAEEEDVEEDLRAHAEAERVALGEDIVDLDVATAMPNVPPDARKAYERALDAYERSGLALQQADTPRRLRAAADLIATGRRDAAAAREATGSG